MMEGQEYGQLECKGVYFIPAAPELRQSARKAPSWGSDDILMAQWLFETWE